MVVPFVVDWAYDVSKLILSNTVCYSYSTNSTLKLFADSATYGSSAVSIFSTTKNPSAQEFVKPSYIGTSFSGYKDLEPLADFVS